MPRTATTTAAHLLVTVKLLLPEGVFAQAEAVASAGAPIAALKEALGDGATVEHSIQHARKPRKAAAVPAVSQRQHAP